MRGLLVRYLPTPVYRILRRLYYLRADLRHGPGGAPPPGMTFLYGSDLRHDQVGDDYLRCFRERAGLKPDDRVLDIGCGIGRITRALAGYLAPAGRYDGLDIVADGIRWCRENITPAHPNFHFQHADIRNRTYNPRGRQSAADYRFPFDDAVFDFCYTTSVFTHMLPEDVLHYLRETARVLKPGGRCVNTFFILDAVTGEQTRRRAHAWDFRYRHGRCALVSRREPEKAIAYDEDFVRELHREAALAIVPPVLCGTWSGRPDGYMGQDIVIARRG